ncbi:MAG: RNA methyltransferase [Planctomycetes bacterium]|nr:RNA methyltransferase [Planctomycetota bacterium]
MTRHAYFATCAPGLEPLLHAEVRKLRLARVEQQVGGVYFEGVAEDAWRANLWLRSAIRLLQRVARFPAADERALYEGVRALDWSRWLRPDGALRVSAQCSDSVLSHSRFVEQRAKDAIVDQFRARVGSRPDVERDEPDLALHVHLWRDRCTLSLDSSGRSLHKRGWRVFQGRAPLSETLAAALVELSEWDGRAPLVDPFCGSGTLLIEAALRQEGAAVGALGAPFGFERWLGHDAAGYARVKAAALAQRERPAKRILLGLDVDPASLEGARANAAAAGLDGRIRFELGDAREFAPQRGWNAVVLTNPPYGHRVGERAEDEGESAARPGDTSIEALEDLYRSFGTQLKKHCAGYGVHLLSGERRLSSALGLAPRRKLRLVNGALPCHLLSFDIR